MTTQSPFRRLQSRVVSLLRADIDTDQIVPARFLRMTDKAGIEDKLFFDWRYLPDGRPDPSFVLNTQQAAGARILVAGDNFGCGSSREHAVWALVASGFRAVVSTSFGDIFRSNALKNQLLPVAVEAPFHERLRAALALDPALVLEIDLPGQCVRMPDGEEGRFPMDPFAKHCLLEGVDALGYLLGAEARIAEYERAQRDRLQRLRVGEI